VNCIIGVLTVDNLEFSEMTVGELSSGDIAFAQLLICKMTLGAVWPNGTRRVDIQLSDVRRIARTSF